MSLSLLLATVWLTGVCEAQGPVARFEIDAPPLVLTGVRFPLEIRVLDDEGGLVRNYEGIPRVTGVERDNPRGRIEVIFEDGRFVIDDAIVSESGNLVIEVGQDELSSRRSLRAIPGVLSILPPVLAIALALVFRQVVISLYAGIWLGAVFVFDYDIVGGFFRVLDHYILNAMTVESHVQIMLFSMLFAGVTGLIARNGGARGMADGITRYARTARGGELASWFTAVVVFFDDYANVLVRGNLLRPITDRLRISREKLSFYVDTGAASVASLFLISTWIGYEVGLIQQALATIDSPLDAYSVVVRSIPYRFYPIFALVLALLIAFCGRDFGPMLAAERRARRTGKVLRDGARPVMEINEYPSGLGGDMPGRWYNGLVPILSIIVVAVFGIYWTGTQALPADGRGDYSLGQIVSSADSYVALLWASVSGCVVAIALSLVQRILSMTQAIEALLLGMKFLLPGILILVLAWSIGSVARELHTADYLIQQMRGILSPFWAPALTFVVASMVSFATGTSFGTMAILMPLVIPLVHTLGVEAELSVVQSEAVLLGSVSSVLAGAVFGDHCSPISDTTILSSMASGADHVDHVRTQLPYALLAAVVGILAGDIPTAFGLSPWISLLVGVIVLTAVLFAVGKRVAPETGVALDAAKVES